VISPGLALNHHVENLPILGHLYSTGALGELDPGFIAEEAGVGDAYDLVAIGQRTQRWYMGASRPTPARLQSNDTNSEALFCHFVPP
jgi:hypothetical protein